MKPRDWLLLATVLAVGAVLAWTGFAEQVEAWRPTMGGEP